MNHLALSLGCLILSSTCLAQTWIQIKPTTSPPPRRTHGTAYDFLRGRMVIFGGTTPSTTYTNDTWEYDGKDWVEIKPTTKPPIGRMHSMVYHLVRGAVLFGGSGGGNLNDTWIWDGKDWTQMKPKNSPSARYLAALAYDSGRQQTNRCAGYRRLRRSRVSAV